MKSMLSKSQTQNYGVEDFHAKMFHLQTKEREKDLTEREVVYSSLMPGSSVKDYLVGLFLKMFPDFLTAIPAKISNFSYKRWMNSGMAFHGEYLMQNTLEHHKDAEESSLLQVMDRYSHPRYFLNKEQLQSLLDRALARKKSLPKDLENAIRNQIYILSNMPQLEENMMLDRKPKDIATMAKPIRLTREAAQMLSVRRLTPSECEKLQGFPPDWTLIDTEPLEML